MSWTRARKAQIAAQIAYGVLTELRTNLLTSQGSSNGGSEERLAPLGIWDRLSFNGESADRSNASPPLLDTGRLLNSVRMDPTAPTMGARTDGANGYALTFTILSADYGKSQAEGFNARNVVLGRTIADRRERNWGDLKQGKDFVVVKRLAVPPRPWNNISRNTLRDIAAASMR